VFGDRGADRTEEQAGEPAVSAAAHHQHPGVAADLQQHPRGATFAHRDLQPCWLVLAEGRIEGVDEDRARFVAGVPLGRYPLPSDGGGTVGGEWMPDSDDLHDAAGGVREEHRPAQCLQGLRGTIDTYDNAVAGGGGRVDAHGCAPSRTLRWLQEATARSRPATVGTLSR